MNYAAIARREKRAMKTMDKIQSISVNEKVDGFLSI